MSKYLDDPEVLEYDSEFPFGKYRGLLVSEVLDEDPDYIKWVIDSTDWEFDEETLQNM